MLKLYNLKIKLLVLFIIISRISAALFSVIIGLKNENGARVSPFVKVTVPDYSFYQKFIENPFFPVLKLFQTRTFDGFKAWATGDMYPGPIFPLLINVSGYDFGSPLFISLFYIVISIVIGLLWYFYFEKKEQATVWEQLVIILYPLALYYMLVISTDLLYCFFVCIFYISTFGKDKATNMSVFFSLLALSLCVLTRPNSITIFPVFIYYIWVNKNQFSKSFISLFAIIFCVIALFGCIYYLPYFLKYNSASGLMSYWGINQAVYQKGVFNNLPFYLNLFLSWSSLGIAKLLYLSGIRASYIGIPSYLLFLRAIGGIMILPGIIFLLVNGHRYDKVLLLTFMVPLFIGASQERYMLPIAPILILYGMRFWKSLFLRSQEREISVL